MLDWFSEIFENFYDFLLEVLPTSPFQQFISELETSKFAGAMGYLNFFFPVEDFLVIFLAWLTSLAVYYIWSVVMRWVRAIA